MAHLIPPITIILIDSFLQHLNKSYTICLLISLVPLLCVLAKTFGDYLYITPFKHNQETKKETTISMSTCYSNLPLMGQNQEILVKDSPNEENVSSFSMRKGNPSRDLIREASLPNLNSGNGGEEDDIEDDESEFKMGRLIRQASLNSSRSSTPLQFNKVMRGSSSLPKYPLQKPEVNQEKIRNMKERNRSKNSMRMGKRAPTIPGGWVDKGSSEDMKAQIKFWAKSVAYNVHQEC